MAEDHAADWPGEEPDRVRGECRHLPRDGRQGGKKELVENECGSRAIEEEVVPLNRRADEAGENDLADGGWREELGFAHAATAGCPTSVAEFARIPIASKFWRIPLRARNRGAMTGA